MKNIHFMNAENRDARVVFGSRIYKPSYKMGIPGREVRFMRYLAAGEMCIHNRLVETLGDDYGDALIEGDPEIDMEHVGRRIKRTETVYLNGTGEVRYAPPKFMEVIISPQGEEVERREPVDVESNIDAEAPVRWTGKQISKKDAVTRFAFTRTIALKHIDGLTFDYLYGMAKTLHESGKMVLVGGGPKGKEPLVFQMGGSPYRGFLEGRIDGDKYKLLLHLSNLELKRPAPKEGGR